MILILDDHPIARQGLCTIIQMNKPEEEIVQAGTVREAIRMLERSSVGMAFIDVNLGKENGFDFLDWVKKNMPETKTFFITSSSRESDFLLAQKMGADAYVLKDAFIDEIVYGLKVVERGGKFYSSVLMERLNRESNEEMQLKELTERELDVLILLSQGYSNAKISETLFISEGTTKKHISSILGKLDLENRVQAVLFASKNSFIIRMALKRAIIPDMRKGV